MWFKIVVKKNKLKRKQRVLRLHLPNCLTAYFTYLYLYFGCFRVKIENYKHHRRRGSRLKNCRRYENEKNKPMCAFKSREIWIKFVKKLEFACLNCIKLWRCFDFVVIKGQFTGVIFFWPNISRRFSSINNNLRGFFGMKIVKTTEGC